MYQMTSGMMKSTGNGSQEVYQVSLYQGAAQGGFQGRCYNCSKSGHKAQDCPNPKVESRNCNICGLKRHLARNCRRVEKGLNMAEDGEPEAESIGEASIIQWGANRIECHEDHDLLEMKMYRP